MTFASILCESLGGGSSVSKGGWTSTDVAPGYVSGLVELVNRQLEMNYERVFLGSSEAVSADLRSSSESLTGLEGALTCSIPT